MLAEGGSTPLKSQAMPADTPRVLQIYDRMSRWPFGRWLFTRVVCFRAPYFGSIRPCFVNLKPGFAEASMRKRRSVQNHIGTVHAIAMANLCELVADTLIEVSLPLSMRWIPKGMSIEYRGKATTDLLARGQIEATAQFDRAMEVIVPVDVFDSSNNVVVHADITMWVSPRPQRD